MSDTASHFKNHVIKTLEGTLRVEHRHAVANSPWPNGTHERIMREVVRALKASVCRRRGATFASGWTWCQRYSGL